MSNGRRGGRPYRLRQRAETMRQTRRRIAAAALELHAEVGPSRATVSAVAERAGVERATVYRHFPDELSLFRACVTHGLEVRPRPDPATWTINDPEARLRAGLLELYRYYRANGSLWANVTRDLPLLPSLQRANAEAGVFEWFGTMRSALLRPWRARARRRDLLAAALGHAIAFSTWSSLTRDEGRRDEDAVEVVVAMVRCLAASET